MNAQRVRKLSFVDKAKLLAQRTIEFTKSPGVAVFIMRNSRVKRTMLASSILLILLTAVTLYFHFYRLSDIPLGVNNDAIWESSSARAIMQGDWQDYVPFAIKWHGEPIVRLMIVALTPLIGNTTTTVKVASALLGAALVPILYLFLKKLFDKKISFITTLFVATSGWHIILSRSGWRAIAVPTVTTLVFYSLYETLCTKQKKWVFISGLALALTLYTYDAARIVPVVCFLGLYGMMMFHEKFRRQHARSIVGITIWFFLASFPMLLYAFRHWNLFIGRTTYLLVTNEVAKYHSLKPLIDNVVTTIGLFIYRGNGNDFFIKEPLLDIPSIWLFPVGLTIVIWNAIRTKSRPLLFVIGWLAIGILPAFLSQPNGNRAVGAIPPTYFCVAYAVIIITRWIARPAHRYKKILQTSLLVYTIAFTTLVTYITYISPYRRIPAGFHPETYVTSRYLKTKQSAFDIYVTDNFPREILTFMLYKNGDPFAQHYTWLATKESFLGVMKKPAHGIIFVFAPGDENFRFSGGLLKKYQGSRRYFLPMTLDNWKSDAALIVEVPPTY